MNNFTNILEAITPIITIIISSVLSFVISRINARNEIKRLCLSFSREDKQAKDEAFTKLIRLTGEYCAFSCGATQYDAIEANAKFLTMAPDSFHSTLNELDVAIRLRDISKVNTLRSSLLEMYSHKK